MLAEDFGKTIMVKFSRIIFPVLASFQSWQYWGNVIEWGKDTTLHCKWDRIPVSYQVDREPEMKQLFCKINRIGCSCRMRSLYMCVGEATLSYHKVKPPTMKGIILGWN